MLHVKEYVKDVVTLTKLLWKLNDLLNEEYEAAKQRVKEEEEQNKHKKFYTPL